ncbi:MAG: OST-HTH/LOTUS domain-containing protein, partial [Bacteroidota bacterium]
FIYIEILKGDDTVAPEKNIKEKGAVKTAAQPLNSINPALTKLLTKSAADLADDTGWTFLGDLGNFIVKKRTDFDPRNYGFPKLLPLIKSTDRFDIDERETGKGNIRHIYIRVKQ